jgi:spore germination cell wall hydrolase CwlJ-like protein
MIDAKSFSSRLSSEIECLSRAVYYEARGEPVEGQLAVAQVIVNRTESDGRFPGTICGVIRQRGQFSFDPVGIPSKAGRAWRVAVGVARIAFEGGWKQMASDALFFHARSVAPGWRLQRITTIGDHIFYR